MGEWTIGQLISNERKRQNLPGEILTQGIGTKQSLYKFEIGQMQYDKLFSDILLQRLGRSSDKLEYILSWNEYRIECIRAWFEECVFKGKKKWAERALSLYEKKIQRLGAVQRMYIHRGQAMIAYWLDKDTAKAEYWLTEALNDTFLQWRENVWEDCRVSTMELENALALVRVWQEEGKTESALLNRCGAYIRKYVKDGEENAKIYSKYAWLAAKQESMAGNLESALGLCVEALNRLRRYNIEYFMQPLLCSIIEYQKRLLFCMTKRAGKMSGAEENFDCTVRRAGEKAEADFLMEETGKEADAEHFAAEAAAALEEISAEFHFREYLDELAHLHEKYGEKWYPQDSILYNCTQKSYHLDFEILRAERCAQGKTQEAVALGVYEYSKEIARIENRKSTPQGRKFTVLMGKLGLEKERMGGFVVTDSFQVLELRKQIQGHISRHQYDEVRPLLKELEQNLDMDCAENRRVIRVIQNMIDIYEKNRSYEEILRDDWEMLRETYCLSPERLKTSPEIRIHKGKKQIYRAPMRNEAELINQIAILLKKLGRKEEAIHLYEWVLETFDRSRVKKEYRYHSYGLLLENAAREKCSIEESVRALRYLLKCGKMGSLGYNYLTLACAMKDDSSNREVCRQMIREVYYLFELSNDYIDQSMVKAYYQKNYGEQL